LPAKPINRATRDEIYEIGIAESLINELSSANLIVRPLSSTRRYADIEQDAIAAGREQKVDYVLASNYQIADGKIRITSQLINVQSGLVEEVFKYEQDNSSIFALQDAVAANIGQSLLKKLSRAPNRLVVKRGTNNEQAYRLYLQGTALADKRQNKDLLKAIEYFEQAVRLDPNYALPYARLSNAQTAFAENGGGNAQEQYRKSKTAIEKALAIDPNLAEAHSYAGEIKSDFEGDFAGAEREHKRAIELDPNSSAAHRMYALLLSYLGRHDESIAESKTVIDLEPASAMNHLIFGRSLLFARRYDEAIDALERTAEMDPEFFFAHQSLSVVYRLTGDDDHGFESFVKTRILRGEEPDQINSWRTIYARSGWPGILERQLEQAKEKEKNGTPNYHLLANLSSDLAQREQTFAYLEKALGQRGTITMLKVHPRFDHLRDDPRFDDLLRRVGLK
jgi:serine/threonine-protein kinase